MDVGVLLAITPPLVTFTTGIIFYLVPPSAVPPAPRNSFWSFLLTAWKFPSVVNLVFGAGYLAYHRTRSQLETRNRQLQRRIEMETAARETGAAELQQARTIQQDLLPKEIAQVRGFDIAGAWEPARVVGGDYYDVIRLSEHRLGICIADVSGKGISAALLMANVQAAVRAFATDLTLPADVCHRVNSVLCTNTATDKFVTLFYGVLDAKSGTLQYTNAGHVCPLHISSGGNAVRLQNTGALLGVFPDWPYTNSILQLRHGDRLLLFTDGITEASTSDGDEFGEDRLVRVAAQHMNSKAGELQSHVLSEVRQFCNASLPDDATLIIINATGVPEPDSLLTPEAHEQVLYTGVTND
jgi:sigma-B regulation protein RsbU (phosphoserine phosphatase)